LVSYRADCGHQQTNQESTYTIISSNHIN